MTRKKSHKPVPADSLEMSDQIRIGFLMSVPFLGFLCILYAWICESPGSFVAVLLLVLAVILWGWKGVFVYDKYFTTPRGVPRSELVHYEFAYARLYPSRSLDGPPIRDGPPVRDNQGYITNASVFGHQGRGREPPFAFPEQTEKFGYVLPGKKLQKPLRTIWTHVQVDTESESGHELWILHALVDRNDKATLEKMWNATGDTKFIPPPGEMVLAGDVHLACE